MAGVFLYYEKRTVAGAPQQIPFEAGETVYQAFARQIGNEAWKTFVMKHLVLVEWENRQDIRTTVAVTTPAVTYSVASGSTKSLLAKTGPAQEQVTKMSFLEAEWKKHDERTAANAAYTVPAPFDALGRWEPGVPRRPPPGTPSSRGTPSPGHSSVGTPSHLRPTSSSFSPEPLNLSGSL